MINVIVNGTTTPYKYVNFPAGERHLILPKHALGIQDNVLFVLTYEGSNDVVDLMLLCDIFRNYKRSLIMKYVPFGRQDRAVNVGEAHSLRAFAKFINSLKFQEVFVSDPHSDVVEALFDNLHIEDQTHCFNATVRQWMHNLASNKVSFDMVISPDMGASKKSAKIAEQLGLPLIQCFKKRDAHTGQILGVGIVDDTGISGSNVIIIDDICDGGRTFVEVAKALKDVGVGRVDLYVTHGIFSKGMGVFDGLIENVFCYNNMNGQINIVRGRYEKGEAK